jgi:bacillithiol biosynthesis cysteine-adding enzyme BshC
MAAIQYTRENHHSASLFSKRDQAYMEDPGQFENFMTHQPKLSSFQVAIDEKTAHYDASVRSLAASVMSEQFKKLSIESAPVSLSLEALSKPNTFSIITAHQPCLMTGPLYFVYKIASCIALAKAIEKEYPQFRIIPMYVVGSEDHDFEEINHLRLYHKRIEWNSEQEGAVGRMKLTGIEAVIDQVAGLLGEQAYSHELTDELKRSYHPSRTLAEATAHFVYTLFGRFGLVVADLDDERLKQLATPLIEKELSEQFAKPLVVKNQSALADLGFDAQIHARDINLFHLSEGRRERITYEKGDYSIGSKKLNKSEITDLIKSEALSFSPNVVLRPLYQQTVLPGISYVGGGAEVAYWMEIQGVFQAMKLPMPMLIRRDSALWIKPFTADLMKKVHISVDQLFVETHIAQESYLQDKLNDDWTLDKIKNAFDEVYTDLFQEIEKIDVGLVEMAKGFQGQHHNFISKAEAKLKKSLKTQNDVAMNRIVKIWDDLFPDGSLQERKDSFLSIYNRMGPRFTDELIERFDPLESGLHVFMESDSTP